MKPSMDIRLLLCFIIGLVISDILEAQEILISDPLDGITSGQPIGNGEFIEGGGWRSFGGKIVYDAGRIIESGSFEAVMRGWTAPAQGVDKSHPLSGWEIGGLYSHYTQPGSFWNWRIGTGYNPFKVLAAPDSMDTREEARVGFNEMVNDGQSHLYKVIWDSGAVSFWLDSHLLHTFNFPVFRMRFFVIGTDDQYGPTNPTPIISEVRILDNNPLIAGFSASRTAGAAPLTVHFTDLSGGPILSSEWDFGDGAINTDLNPSHVYPEEGRYEVSLRIIGAEYVDSCVQTITVNGQIDSWVDPENFLHIPMAGVRPEIDGLKDPVWYSVPAIKCLLNTAEDPDEPYGSIPDDFLDATVSARAMWDGDAFYFFAEVFDDQPGELDEFSWMSDAFELYFDGNNSKGESFDNVDDIQWRWVYGESGGDPGPGGETLAWQDTEFGFNFEMRIPADEMTFPLAADHEFGLEIQYNDRDNGDREHLIRWWETSHDTWFNASLFGNAVLSGWQASDTLHIEHVESGQIAKAGQTAFIIDGLTDERWFNVPLIPMNIWISDPGPFLMSDLIGYWDDCSFDYRACWDIDYLYAIIYQRDDAIHVSGAELDENDSIILYLDGNNSKGDTLDLTDDSVWSWSLDGMTGYYGISEAVVVRDSGGVTLELAIPWTELAFVPVPKNLFGWDFQVNDRDDNLDDIVRGRWWSAGGASWISPAQFGIARFTGSVVDTKSPATDLEFPHEFALSQNYPNPFNPATSFQYCLDKDGPVRLTLYDLLGREILQLVDETQETGRHTVDISGEDLPSGIYLYKLESAGRVLARKLTILK